MKQKFICLVLVACTIHVAAFAQPAIKYQRTMGGYDDDYCTSIYLTNDGGLIAGGTSSSPISGEKTQTNRGFDDIWQWEDYWILKLDSLGNIQWDKTIGGDYGDDLFSLQQTTDSGYILGGSSWSSLSWEKTEFSRGGNDYWIVRLDRLGNIQWDKTIGGYGDDELRSLQQTSDGGYILGGYSYSNISGEKTQNSRGGDDYWMVKLDSLGNIEWDKTIGGSSPDYLSSLQQTSDGGYILGGYSSSIISGEKTGNNRCDCDNVYSYDYWVVKLDSLGNIQWDKTIGGGSPDYLSSLQQTRDGGYILGGYSESRKSYEKTEHRRGLRDYWVVKLDSLGNIQWDKTIGGGDYYNQLYSLLQTTDNGYILGGNSSSNISYEKTENSRGYFDYWVVKLNNRGKVQWDKTIGGSDNDYLRSIKEIEKNHYILGGFSYSGKSGDKTQWDRRNEIGGHPDYWLVELKYIRPDSITVATLSNTNNSKLSENNSNKYFTLYPNPVKNILHIQTTEKAALTLTDQSGKIILTKNIYGKGEVNVANLPAGLYYLKNTSTGTMQKIIITK